MSFLDSKYPVKAILVVIILYIGYTMFKKLYYLNDNILTVGIIYDEYSANGIPYIKYKYKVTDKWYFKKAGSNNRKSKNIFYHVKYSKKKPEISQILLDEPVKDTVEIKNAGFKLNE